MPEVYRTDRFYFSKVKDGDGGAYYNITNMYCGGKTWDYSHWFSSIQEMIEYSNSH